MPERLTALGRPAKRGDDEDIVEVLPPRRLHGSKRRAVRGDNRCCHAVIRASGTAATAARGLLVARAVVADLSLIVGVMLSMRRVLAMAELMLCVRGVGVERQRQLRHHRRRQQREGDNELEKRLDGSSHSVTISDRS